jgi:tight adherence protein B
VRAILPVVAGLGVFQIFKGITDARPGRRNPLMRRLDALASESGIVGLSGARMVGFSLLASVATFVVIAGVTASATVAGSISLAAGWLPISITRSRRDRRLGRFRQAWPDVIAHLIAGVRAGIPLSEACVSLAQHGPGELQTGFRAFANAYRASGSFDSGLDALQIELADPVADRVVAALRLAHEVGGTDLVRVLRALGDFVSSDLRIRKEIEARWSWTVTAARVAAASPWVVLVIMSTRPEAAAAYSSSGGIAVIVVGAAATVVGFRLMLRAARLPEERRLGG